MKFIEVGLGNTWFIRTETEFADGTEFEQRGIVGPVKFKSCYVRVWINHSVLIIDSRDGVKKSRKARKAFKLIVGIRSLL